MNARASIGALLAVLLVVCSTAVADFSFNVATLDWSSLQITGPDIVWLEPPEAPSRFSRSDAKARHWTTPYTAIVDTDSDLKYPWVNTDAEATASSAMGQAWTDANSLRAYAKAYDQEDASARAKYEGRFMAVENGTLQISVDYTLEQTIHRTDPYYTLGMAYAGLTLGNTSTTDPLNQLDQDEKDWFLLDVSVNRGPAGGTLVASLPFKAYEAGGFTAEVIAAAEAYPCEDYVIPTPSAVVLGMLGLCGVGVVRQRLKRNAV